MLTSVQRAYVDSGVARGNRFLRGGRHAPQELSRMNQMVAHYTSRFPGQPPLFLQGPCMTACHRLACGRTRVASRNCAVSLG